MLSSFDDWRPGMPMWMRCARAASVRVAFVGCCVDVCVCLNFCVFVCVRACVCRALFVPPSATAFPIFPPPPLCPPLRPAPFCPPPVPLPVPVPLSLSLCRQPSSLRTSCTRSSVRSTQTPTLTNAVSRVNHLLLPPSLARVPACYTSEADIAMLVPMGGEYASPPALYLDALCSFVCVTRVCVCVTRVCASV